MREKNIKKSFRAALLMLALVASSLVIPSQSAQAITRPGYNGLIAFEADTDGDYDIYTFNPATSATIKLIESDEGEWGAVWSPDATKIAFVRDVSGNREVFIANSDGSDQINVTNNAASDYFPKWTPDGQAIIFISARSGTSQLYRYTITGGQTVPLTEMSDGYVWGERLELSPDGASVAFTKMVTSDMHKEVHVTSAKTVGPTQRIAQDSDVPQWLPDGSGLLYEDTSSYPTRIARYNLADGSITPITNGVQDDYNPTISPDGSLIAYASWRNNQYQIRTVRTDGSNDRAVQYEYDNYAISGPGVIGWSPDGNYILILLYDAGWGASQLYLAPKDGSTITPITSGDHYVDHSTVPMGGLWQTISNKTPATVNDTLVTQPDTAALIDVLANDTDEEEFDGANLTIALQPTNGTASVVDGKVRYVPNSGYRGPDSLTYQICDSFVLDQKCATAVLSITVQAPGGPTLSIGKIAGINFNESTGGYTTPTFRPTFSGTASPGAEIKVEIHSDPIVLLTTADESGNWSVTPSFDLPSGEHMVYISATLNGLTTELHSFRLTIQPTLASTGESLAWVVVLPVGAMLLGGTLLASMLRKQF